MNSAWVFNLGAEVYGWFTAQAAWRQSCRELACRLIELHDARIADLGCGPGVSTFELARLLPTAHLTGVDVAPRMLGQARSRYRRQRDLQAAKRIQWLLADAACLPLASASLDACTGHSFLYLVANRDGVLAEVKRVLKPGGRLVLMEPNARRVSVKQTLGISRDPRHLFSVSLWRPFSRLHGRFTTASLMAALRAAGFVQCEAEETFGGLGVLATAFKANEGA